MFDDQFYGERSRSVLDVGWMISFFFLNKQDIALTATCTCSYSTVAVARSMYLCFGTVLYVQYLQESSYCQKQQVQINVRFRQLTLLQKVITVRNDVARIENLEQKHTLSTCTVQYCTLLYDCTHTWIQDLYSTLYSTSTGTCNIPPYSTVTGIVQVPVHRVHTVYSTSTEYSTAIGFWWDENTV